MDEIARPLPASRATQRILRDYRPRPGVPDELLDAEGRMRPVWTDFLDHLAEQTPEAMRERFNRGDLYLRDAGVYFRRYSADATGERDWPLSHIPVILHADEWEEISEGLIQRAELLESVVADLYGAQSLIADGHLPPEIIADNPEWLRPMVGVRPASGHFLHFLAFEIGRSPDGSWFVLGDRTQAPSGAGFALENRMATSRVFPEAFATARVSRLAGFFRAFREGLDELRDEAAADGRIPGNSRPAILTPGPSNDTYFEHTYIARYLGLMLLEGEDLVVVKGQVMVRTVSGLKPVSVLWRRLDASYADPLELQESSRIGTPGLVSALREGSVSMVNALGAGVLETRALLAFLPRIAPALTGEPLKLPNIATWWCGQAKERAHVVANAERMMIGQALSTAMPFSVEAEMALGGRFADAADDRDIAAWIEAKGAGLVGQEAVTLSTTPVWQDDGLVPRPMTVRVFAARTPQGWQIMPGGYARIGRKGDATALAMQQGGSVADVWIAHDEPVPQDTLMKQRGASLREAPSVLPSRAADNLFWLGRYVERCESTIRLLRAWHLRLEETGGRAAPQISGLAAHLKFLGIDPARRVPAALFDQISAAETCAGKVRDRFSVDAWWALRDLATTAQSLDGKTVQGDDSARAMGLLLRRITGFAGLVHENMYRFAGWRFLSLGRALERADNLAHLLAAFTDETAPDGSWDLLVELGDSVMTHRRRYRIDTTRDTVVDLMALDANNPRSVLFQVAAMRDHAERLPNARVSGKMEPLGRDLLRIETDLTVGDPEEWTAERFWELRGDLSTVAGHLAAKYLG
ncbi:circularly permuted type 2 ATP-grasp protein [Pseudooceanicola nanhaiensis]|uniref:circularly permuted type 2 ATP-grasp protein n=1 Tax=Pseudooceanicola nanhaiensis TaxID=375761 RepID=UPI0035174D1E